VKGLGVLRVIWRARIMADIRVIMLGMRGAEAKGVCGVMEERGCLGIMLTCIGLDINKCTMKDVYTKFGLEAGTQDFVGHAMALWLDDE
jgi:hypothetical protein